MNYNSRRLQTPGASRKQKESEPFYWKPLIPSTSVSGKKPNPYETTSSKIAAMQPVSSNQLLAGYMAYEFLTKGTLLGQNFDPTRVEAVPVNSAESKRNESSSEAEPNGKLSMPPSYAEVANLLKSDGAHIPGVVNPSQLARWIQM